jgi:hypothetical protein
MIKQATITDYISIQGGRPTIFNDENGLFHILHAYQEMMLLR